MFTQVFGAYLGTIFFAMLLQLRGIKLFMASLGGLLTWTTYIFFQAFDLHAYMCGFLAAIVLTLYAEIMARIFETPVTIFLVSATIPLIPGASLYRAMSYLMLQNYLAFFQEGSYTLIFATCMSAGITLTTIVFRIIWQITHQQRRV